MSQIQFNLLPPSRMDDLANRKQQDHYTLQAIKIALLCLGLFILSLVYGLVVQRAQIASVKNDIKTKSAQLQKIPNINAILTVQNQLQAAANLHQNQHVTSRTFVYLAKIVPSNASVNAVSLDLTTNTIKIDGIADSATTANALVDALKTAQIKLGTVNPTTAFSQVIESSFAITEKGVSYSLSAKFDPRLFAGSPSTAQEPSLSVPNSSTVRSSDPGSLFGGGQ